MTDTLKPLKRGAVGCLIKSVNYDEYETKFGIPRLLAGLKDGIFKGLPVGDAKLWPERFFGAIRPGADLSKVFYHFMHWLLVNEDHGVLKYAKTEKSKKTIHRVADLYAQYLAGNAPTRETWAVAAYADAAADAAAVARKKSRIAQANKLIELLEAA